MADLLRDTLPRLHYMVQLMWFASRAFPRLALGLIVALPLPLVAQSGPEASAPRNEPVRTRAVDNPAAAKRTDKSPAPVAALTIPIDTSPWLFKGSDIPPDPEWHFGRLPNGLRYAVRRNGVPPGQVAVRVRIDAGSLNERDAEQGYAHLIEHLSFRGSKYVPDGEAKRVWQRFGATFGSDSNASTTPTQTVYKLNLPAATDAALDESLKIFAGMMEQPAITAQGLAAERPAVLAEQREQPGPQVRFGDALRKTFFAGQPLAERSPIGTVATLAGATPASVQEFHDRWYRPENAVVIVSGDLDPETLSRLVVKNFADWRGRGPAVPAPDFGKPDDKAPATQTVVEPSIPPVVVTGVMRPWTYRDDTIAFNQDRMVDFIAARVINRRLETRARAGGSFIQAGVSVDDISRSANATTVNILPIGDDWEAALKDVRAVIADAMATAPTQGEIDREVAEYAGAMKNEVDTARVEAGSKQADDMVQALDIRETVAGPKVSADIFEGARTRKLFTPAAVLASTKRIFTGDATRAILNVRTPDPAASAKLAAALKADVSGLAGKRVQQAAVDFSRLPRLGTPGKIVSRETIPDLEMERVTFANGVRLLLLANASESGRVYLRARFGGGYNALPADRQSAAWAGEIALMASGVGKLGQGDLDALTTGRRMGLNFDIADDAFTIDAMTTPGDYADNLKLIAAKLAAPGWDPAPVARARAVTLSSYDGFDASPDGVIGRDLDGLLHAGDPRWGVPPRAAVEALDAKAFRALWEPLLATGPIEVSVFGDIKPDEAIAAVAATFGAMKPRKASTTPPPPVRFPAHVTTPVVRTHGGPDTQAAAVIAWPTGGGADAIAESRQLDVLAAVFSDRLFDRLRSEAGASYSPSVQSQWPVGLASGGRLTAIGQVPPDKVTFFFQLARTIAAELAAKPIDQDELQRTLRPIGQSVIRASSSNQFFLYQTSGGAYDPRRIEATRNIMRDYATITPATLQALAAKYLRPETDWTMAVLPRTAGAAGVPVATAGTANPAR